MQKTERENERVWDEKESGRKGGGQRMEEGRVGVDVGGKGGVG
jgi:hypothetical protein